MVRYLSHWTMSLIKILILWSLIFSSEFTYSQWNKKREKNKYYADKLEPKASKISTILFAIIILGALLSEWETFINNFVLLGPAIVLLILTMLIIAYKSSKLFKMSDKQSITVAIESAMQNGTVGITVGNLIINPESGLSILSIPSGVYSILMYLICLPFVFWFLKRTPN